jgi:hypothetical protein
MKHFAGKVLAIAGVATLIGLFQYKAKANDDHDWGSVEQRRINEGFKIAPVHLNLAHKDPELVGLGSYLVNAGGGCNDCHTNPNFAPGGDPFQGQKKQINSVNYLAGGIAFGPFVSRNLTPEKGLPAGHTFVEFREILRTGKDFDNPGQLLQVMPWPTYQDLSDHDIRAIYEYLRAIPPAEPGV